MSSLPVGDSEVGEVNDLATLAKLDESILLNEVKARYQNDRIYTYVGDILVSVNPFQDLGIYGKNFSDTYRNVKRREDEPPHIYAVADRLYQDMRGIRGADAKNQCVLISGESGAGKTECTKLIIKQLIDLCQGNNQLQQQILQVNPLLEAFGNAQTLMNDNSSRFGKYIQLKFVEGRVLGAKISEYLLEKSRMVRQSEGEANFHIFYYMFAGLSVADQTQYKLQDVDNYKYFSDGADCLQTDAKLLKERYEELINAIEMVGFTDKEQEDMFAILAATLTVGNIEVGADDIGVAVVSESSSHIKDVTELLGLDKMEMHSCISCSITFTKGEQIRRNYTVAQSEEARDAVAKALYGRLFSWIVNRINTLLVPREFFNPDKVQEIGILDIFGFEHFELNSFEQACINLANEQLQFFFNKHIFMLEQEEYRGEGINWKEIKFVDNKSLLDLFLGRPIGILALLDEESFFPKGSDQSYVAKMNQKFAKNPHYIQSTQGDAKSFTIAHYAGHVTYDSTDWLEKNRDTLPPGVMEMLQQSTNKLLSLIFKGKISRTGTLALNHKTTKKSKFNQPLKAAEATKHRKLTVGHQFKNSLSVLMERMTQSQPVFIRCIKPNSKKSPKLFEDEYVKAQLLYTGMLETTKIRREGFAIRPSFREFVERYKLLIHMFKLEPTAKSCKKILDSTKLTGCQIGKTKVFLKYWHLDKLAELMEVLAKQAVHMQRVVRGYLGRQRTKRLRKEAAKKAQEVKNLLHQVEKNSTTAMNDQNKMLNGDKSVPKDFFDKNKNTTTAPRILSFGGTDLTGGASNDGKVKLRHKQNGQQVDSDSDAEDEFVPLDPEELAKFGKPGTKAAAMNWFLETQKSTVRHSEDGFAEWFHGFISRRDAEKLLKNSSVGCFLIRISESRIGYSLSFRAKDRTRHYMIDQLPNGKLIVVGENKVHRTLHYLTDYLKTHMLSNWDGYLTEPCGQLPGQCDYAELLDENDKEYVEYRSSRVLSRRISRCPLQ